MSRLGLNGVYCTTAAKRAIFELGRKIISASNNEFDGVHSLIDGSSVTVKCMSEGTNNSVHVVIAVADKDAQRARALGETIWQHMH